MEARGRGWVAIAVNGFAPGVIAHHQDRATQLVEQEVDVAEGDVELLDRGHRMAPLPPPLWRCLGSESIDFRDSNINSTIRPSMRSYLLSRILILNINLPIQSEDLAFTFRQLVMEAFRRAYGGFGRGARAGGWSDAAHPFIKPPTM